ncbi:hypothetical protein [Streptomyces sp. NPDC048845]|uniref:hypothetical protein n=1 Tax=Streptomyces sp. NPDC048845 TaxID=3155390 RepID=UPI00341F4E52
MFPLRLERVVHRVFPPGESRIDDAFSVRHFTDLTAAYGTEFRPGAVSGGAGNTFAAMSKELVGALGAESEPVGLAVVAHSTPDLDCRYAAATYLSEAWPHGPLSFGVSEQGSCTPFSALRLAAGYTGRHGLRAAVVLILDQASLPYDTGPAELGGDAGVALLLSASQQAGPRPDLRYLTGVATPDVREVLAGELARYEGRATVVAGPGVDPARDLPAGLAEVRRTGKGFPCTGLWSALAGPRPADRPLVLVDHDPVTRWLGLCAVGPAEAER